MTSSNVWLVHVVPSFGNLLASIMLISPVPAVLRLRVTGKLGDLNPLPLPLTMYNSMGWLAYGFATSNAYLFPSNSLGFVAGMFFTLTAHSVASRQTQDRIMGISLTASAHFILMGIISLFGLSEDAAKRMWGINAIIILMAYYLVPLATMADIVRRRSAASIYPPLAVAAVANGGLWTIYGFALRDVNLWLPNLFGAVIGVVQLLLRVVYGAVPEPPAGSPAVLAAGGAPGATAGVAAGVVEAPERHPAAKHPGAKDTRRASILTLLNPYHFMSHEDAAERGASASAASTSAGSASASLAGPGATGPTGIALAASPSAASLTATTAKPTATTATPTAASKAARLAAAD